MVLRWPGKDCIKTISIVSSFSFVLVACAIGADIEKITLDVPRDMTRADLYVRKVVVNPRAVVVLTPGTNGSGEKLLHDPAWRKFAERNHLAMVGVSFASNDSILREEHGYYHAAQGSGQALLDGIRKAFHRDLPIVLFGFSAGAHFTSRFVEWKPDRVVTWCAYSAGWWDEPQSLGTGPPGIVACGDEDSRLGASLIYFKQGRASGKPWLWIQVPETGHSCPATVQDFVRRYFDVVLDRKFQTTSGKFEVNPEKAGMWVDIDRLTPVDPKNEHPALTAWLPNRDLYERWKELNSR